MTAERRGADVGERGDESVMSTGCPGGKRLTMAVCRSSYNLLSLGISTAGSGSDNASNAYEQMIIGRESNLL